MQRKIILFDNYFNKSVIEWQLGIIFLSQAQIQIQSYQWLNVIQR